MEIMNQGMAQMISWTKTEVVIEDDLDEESQINLDWWIARCEYFKDKYLELQKENKELRKKLKKQLTSSF